MQIKVKICGVSVGTEGQEPPNAVLDEQYASVAVGETTFASIMCACAAVCLLTQVS